MLHEVMIEFQSGEEPTHAYFTLDESRLDFRSSYLDALADTPDGDTPYPGTVYNRFLTVDDETLAAHGIRRTDGPDVELHCFGFDDPIVTPPCEACGGSGIIESRKSGCACGLEADHVERCDTCERYTSDIDAARAHFAQAVEFPCRVEVGQYHCIVDPDTRRTT